MTRSLGYADAVRLLGGQDSAIVGALEKLTGGVLLGTAPVVPALLGWFDAKAEFVRLSQDLIREMTERRSGLSRYARTERLEAAHAVIVVTAFFQSVDEATLPFRFADLEISAEDKINLAARAGARPLAAGPITESAANLFLQQLMETRDFVPGPQRAPEEYRRELHRYYTRLAIALDGFMEGLSPADDFTTSDRGRVSATLLALPDQACRRYQELFWKLTADFPEVACWAGQREHQATRAALAGIEHALRAISTGQAPDQRRRDLATAYRADLGRPIVESGDVPDGIHVPTLGEAHLPPLFRVADVRPGARVSDESWWTAFDVRQDLEEFLIGYLTSTQASRAPLLVLGQPGSGKSVLTRVLAARLPPSDFLPIRVVLRDAPAADILQDQIEHAIRLATGEHVEWPALSRTAGDAMPVILLDGFDELLQAVGVSQTDYLLKVAKFQRREADFGRPLAVVVTSRTAVADRARTPEETVALRLEPFDGFRVAAWLDIWNGANAANFAARGLKPLSAATALTHPSLAEQPLLLLMLALYDAEGNALQRVSSSLRVHELYEQLLGSYAVREITRHTPGLSPGELRKAVENELRRLSIVAFAMFNRSALWVTEADLELDLAALPICPPPRPPAEAGLRTPLRAGELTLGRFFFIHRARAAQDENRVETYEFLHATFSEFFVARLICQALSDMLARESASTMSFNAPSGDDDLLRALLSGEPLCLRTPIIDFVTRLVGMEQRPALKDLLLRIFRQAAQTPSGHRFAAYRPRLRSEPAGYAAYSANLLLLLLCTTEGITASELFGIQEDPVEAWHRQTLLWRSQLSTDGWESLVETIGIERRRNVQGRDVRLTRAVGYQPIPHVDLSWSVPVSPHDREQDDIYHNAHDDRLRRAAHFQCSKDVDIAHHALEALFSDLRTGVGLLVTWDAKGWDFSSPAHELLGALIDPTEDSYIRCARIAASTLVPGDGVRYTVLLLRQLATESSAEPKIAKRVLSILLADPTVGQSPLLRDEIVRCALAFLGRETAVDFYLARVLNDAVDADDGELDPVLRAEAIIRLHFIPYPSQARHPQELEKLARRVAVRRPDLLDKLTALTRVARLTWPK